MLSSKLECLPVSTEAKTPFGAWLREEMLRQGYEVDGPRAGGRTLLAKRSGISLSIISRILNDDRVPDLPALRAIGKALGYGLGQMMVFAGLAEPGELPESVVRVSQVQFATPEPRTQGVRVERYDERHLHADVVIDTDVTMDEAIASLGALSDNERATVYMLRGMEYAPAEVAGAVLMLRELAARRASPGPTRRKKA
jgi:transcriptional regulator with XRE-family HTH domain